VRIGVNALFLIPGEVGGSETYVMETLSAMAAERSDVELVIFTNREAESAFRARFSTFSSVRVEPLALRATNRYARILAEQTVLPSRAARAGIQVLWSPGYTAPMICRCPQAVSILDMQYRSHPEDLAPLARWVTHFLVCGAARRCARILAISDFSRDEIVRFTGVSADRVSVTHLGVDPAFGQAVDPAALSAFRRDRLGFAEPYVLCVANSYPHKNLHHLVEAFSRAADRIPHRLVIVGRPRLGEAQLQKALAQAPRDRVTRIERVGAGDLVALYQSCAVFVFPSLYEGFGLPVLEAMKAGVPVITTRRGSLPEVGGDAVRYVSGTDPAELAEALVETVNEPAVSRFERLRAARLRADSFTWQATGRATLAVLARVGNSP
jgi:glycosyltransferase involved in cell wall biosynthesis